ncbi:hypothetical protein A3H16_01195 [Candidatus Kaiserbacteria bacterium RIFCSPLOWO2_12_FULL_53_8]|uniref:Uncharacterized protein n=2 Tax=Candidatus Kaiseribacteriota TaxID=1752734 RepID=A0A1F6CTC7_9BACT|nr:MAG: hypothetical protein A2851_04865 [Candidatus Kaiserbacteria bacterium RIFCSPHIGHO2_01_FULL_53_29]OGG90894.1 MAG: hypothetical protein A3H16_01195 [Candidatus Kaiserbacteria bacterium RIFCSPLOWO2_12_FULL_53_8]
MEDAELRQKLDALEAKIAEVYTSAEKTRKYFLAVVIVSVVAFVLPLVGFLFAIPSFLSTYSEVGDLLQ